MISENFTGQLSDVMAQENVPGLSLAFIQDSKVSEHLELGLIEHEREHTVSCQTFFQGASLAKPLTAFAIMELVGSGLLHLEKPLCQYLFNKDLEHDYRAQLITARHILSHVSGLPNWRFSEQLQLYFLPGTRFSYSGEGYEYLQRVVENLTQEHFDSYIQRTVFERFDMRHSLMSQTHEIGPDFAVGHDSKGKPLSPLPRLDTAYNLYTTSTDFAKFMIAATSLSNQMIKPQVKVNDSAPWQSGWPHQEFNTYDDVFWGLGWGIEQTSTGPYCWHWGDNPGFKCFAIADQNTQTGLVILTNGDNGRNVYSFLINRFIQVKHPALDWLECVYK